MKNPTIKITGPGRAWFNYTITIPRKDGASEVKGSARSGEPIEIPITEEVNDESLQ